MKSRSSSTLTWIVELLSLQAAQYTGTCTAHSHEKQIKQYTHVNNRDPVTTRRSQLVPCGMIGCAGTPTPRSTAERGQERRWYQTVCNVYIGIFERPLNKFDFGCTEKWWGVVFLPPCLLTIICYTHELQHVLTTTSCWRLFISLFVMHVNCSTY